MKSIVSFIPRFFPSLDTGGPIRSTAALASGLRQYCRCRTLIVCEATSLEESAAMQGRSIMRRRIEEFDVLYVQPRWDILAHVCYRLVVSPRFDTIFITGVFNFISISASFFAMNTNKITAIFPRGSLLKKSIAKERSLVKYLFLNLIYFKLLKKINILAVTSKKEADDLSSFYASPKKIFEIPNPVFFEGDATTSKIEMSVLEFPVVLFLGRFHKNKRIDLLVELAKNTPEFSFVFCGYPGNFLFGELPANAVKYPPVHGSQKVSILRDAAIVISIGESENFSNVLAEALVLGTPVVTIDEVGISDYIGRFDGGVVARSTEISELKRCVQLCWKRYQGRISAEEQENYSMMFSQRTIALRLEEKIDQCKNLTL